MSAHRRPPTPPSFSKYPTQGHCRWCDKPILKKDGTPNRRRLWHPGCADIYKVAAFRDIAGWRVLDRDGGVCAACRQKVVVWEIDHVVPLWSVDPDEPDAIRYWLIDNLQTLCRPCHKAKTARESAERAKIRQMRKEKMA